jgi:putative ATPase
MDDSDQVSLSLFGQGPGPGEAPAPAAPLAERMRPERLDGVIGQEAVVGEGAFLRRALAEDRVPSLIFWGLPGCGQTTLAHIIAAESRCQFVPFSAVTSGIKEIKAVMRDAARLQAAQGQRTLLFVDEIHRFNRAQQDAFLPYVERGEIVLVGATTENPSFELNGALLSRCRVVVLEPLGLDGLCRLMLTALVDAERGLGRPAQSVDEEALSAIAQHASGDARRALNLLELCVADQSPEQVLDVAAVAKVAQRKVLLYDKSGEEHFNLISALHKSLRESDPDASVYWLQRMLDAGEDPRYVARRLVRFASEDVGLADPRALGMALDGWRCYERLGTPEGEIGLVQVVIYLALAPKSVAVYRAQGAVRRTVQERPAEPVPLAIRNAPTDLMKGLGYGRDYVYAPDTEHGVAGLECLPDALAGERFYHPSGEGHERELRQRLEDLDRLRRSRRRDLSD